MNKIFENKDDLENEDTIENEENFDHLENYNVIKRRIINLKCYLKLILFFVARWLLTLSWSLTRVIMPWISSIIVSIGMFAEMSLIPAMTQTSKHLVHLVNNFL